MAERLRRPVFMIVTNDPPWAKEQIPRGFRPVFTGLETDLQIIRFQVRNLISKENKSLL